jgi:hypothetical protein
MVREKLGKLYRKRNKEDTWENRREKGKIFAKREGGGNKD